MTLPCTSSGSAVVASESGQGHYYIVCPNPEAETVSVLHGEPGRPKPEAIAASVASGGVLLSPRRMVYVAAPDAPSPRLMQLDIDPNDATVEPVSLGAIPRPVGAELRERGGYGTSLAWVTADGQAWIHGASIGRLH